MSIGVQQITYIHPDKELLFENVSFSVKAGQKIALIGNNGSGKSTMLQLIKGNLPLSSGKIVCSSDPYFVPQHFGQYNNITVAEALQVDKKIKALNAILKGEVSESNFTDLSDDWNIEERTLAALSMWKLDNIKPGHEFAKLSGGEKTRVFLAGISIHSHGIILMDEPTNHLDYDSRDKLYDLIQNSNSTILVITHDRALLNIIPEIYELTKKGINYFPGNYEFYREQKEMEFNFLQSKLEEREKELRLAKKTARETMDRKQKSEAHGKKKHDKARTLPYSSSKLKEIHNEKLREISKNLNEIKEAIPEIKKMKTDFDSSELHKGKILFTAKDINYNYNEYFLWKENLNFQVRSGERINIKGRNGSGKTTLINIITGKSEPTKGILDKIDFSYIYLDQEYSIIENHLSVYDQVQQFNANMPEHEIKIILNRFLFNRETWEKKCIKLSGGEKMKLSLCCLMVSSKKPDIFILDEPTNNIDIQNIEILTSAIKEYQGTVIVVSHDEYFLNQIDIQYTIEI